MDNQQTIKSSDVTLGRLVAELNYLFCVPNYQRHYVWTEKEVLLFLKDGEFCWKRKVEDKKRYEHFAGQLILRKIEEDRVHRSRMEIVDGQQRLTTFMLLVSSAIRMIHERKLDLTVAEELERKYFASQPELGNSARRLELSPADQRFWEYLTNWREERGKCIVRAVSHKLLKKAEENICEYLEKLVEGKTDAETCEILKTYVEALANSFRFVLLETTQPGYMYALYQIVNDRGVPLTSGELLKARILELFSDKKAMAKQAEEMWEDILSDPGKTTDTYFEWNYIAVTGRRMEKKGKASLHEQYERDIFHCYNKRILSESEQLAANEQLEQLHINVLRLRNLENGVLPVDGVSEHTKVWFEALIRLLRNTASIPLYLKIMEMDEPQIAKTINNITPLLAKAFFMAKTMGGAHDESISRCYLEIWNHIDRKRADMDKIRACLKNLVEKNHYDKEFGRLIEQDIYVHGHSSNTKAKFLLLVLELEHYWKAETGKKECGDDSVAIRTGDLSIEHILKDSVDELEVSREFYNAREQIGNLTLIGKRLNSRLKDKDFKDKKAIYLDSPYWITRQVGMLPDWKRDDFLARQKEVVADLKAAFTLG